MKEQNKSLNSKPFRKIHKTYTLIGLLGTIVTLSYIGWSTNANAAPTNSPPSNKVSERPSTVKGPISVICETASSKKWHEGLKKLMPEYEFTMTDYETFLKTSKKPGILLLPEGALATNIKDAGKNLRSYLDKGGKIIAFGNAGYIDKTDADKTSGRFQLTELLRAGKKICTIPILYIVPRWAQWDLKIFENVAKSSMENGAGGVMLFSYQNAKKNSTSTIGEIFSKIDSWKTEEALIPLGLPATPKILYADEQTNTPPEDLVNYARNIRANVICMASLLRWKIPGYVMYPTKYSELRSPAANNSAHLDYLPRIIKLAKENNIQVWANLHIMSGLVEPFPEEQQILNTGEKHWQICPLAAQKHYTPAFLKALKELLEEYPYINAVMLEEPGISCKMYKRWACFCPECKKLFKEISGHELSSEHVLREKAISDDFTNFRVKLVTEYMLKPVKDLLNSTNPNIKMGFSYNIPTIRNIGFGKQEVSDAGMDMFCPEFLGKKAEDSSISTSNKLIDFNFNNLEFAKDSDFFMKNSLLKAEGTGLKVDAFNGAKIMAWLSDGLHKYPGIVTANHGKSIYFSFDPLTLPTQQGKELLKEALNYNEDTK